MEQVSGPGAIAHRLEMHDDYVLSVKADFYDFLTNYFENPQLRRRLFTLSAMVAKIVSFAKKRHHEDLDEVCRAWEEQRLIVPFAIQSDHSADNIGDDGFRIKGGFFGFLKNHPIGKKRIVVDSFGEEHQLHGAPRQQPVVSALLWDVFEPLGLLRYQQNGRRRTTTLAIDHFPNLLIFAEVIEKMITERHCFEAVPDWHKSLREDYNYVFGMNTYNRSGDDRINTPSFGTYGAMVAFHGERVPAKRQSVMAFLEHGGDAARDHLLRCCGKFTRLREGVVEAFVRIGGSAGDLVLFAKGKAEYTLEMMDEAVDSILAVIAGHPPRVYEPQGVLDELPF